VSQWRLFLAQIVLFGGLAGRYSHTSIVSKYEYILRANPVYEADIRFRVCFKEVVPNQVRSIGVSLYPISPRNAYHDNPWTVPFKPVSRTSVLVCLYLPDGWSDMQSTPVSSNGRYSGDRGNTNVLRRTDVSDATNMNGGAMPPVRSPPADEDPIGSAPAPADDMAECGGHGYFLRHRPSQTRPGCQRWPLGRSVARAPPHHDHRGRRRLSQTVRHTARDPLPCAHGYSSPLGMRCPRYVPPMI